MILQLWFLIIVLLYSGLLVWQVYFVYSQYYFRQIRDLEARDLASVYLYL